MRALLLLVAIVCTGCFAAPPAPASGAMLTGCHPGSYGARSSLRCRRHSDCVLCGCERLETRADLMLANPTCPQPNACEQRAACCGGRCVVSLGPPPLRDTAAAPPGASQARVTGGAPQLADP